MCRRAVGQHNASYKSLQQQLDAPGRVGLSTTVTQQQDPLSTRMSAEEEDRLDFGEDDDDRESEISLGLGGQEDVEAEAEAAEDGQQASRQDEAEVRVEQSTSSSSANGAARAAQFSEKQTEDGRPLPAGWIRKTSSKGETYYLNLETRKSTWDEPVAEAERSYTPPPRAVSTEKLVAASKREAQTSSTNTGASYARVAASGAAVHDDARGSSTRSEKAPLADDKGTSARLPALIAAQPDPCNKNVPLISLYLPRRFLDPLSRSRCRLPSVSAYTSGLPPLNGITPS